VGGPEFLDDARERRKGGKVRGKGNLDRFAVR
jgi:hypothetical protein